MTPNVESERRPPWQVHFPDACDWDAPLEIGTLSDLLDKGVALAGDRPAIDFRGRRIGYRELDGLVDGLAAGLLAMDLAPSTPVALLLPNTPDHPVAFFAAMRAGLTVVHLSPLDAPRELAHKLAATGARVLVTTNLPGLLPAAAKLLDAGALDRLLVADDARWGRSDVAPSLPIPERADIQRIDALFGTPHPAAWPTRTADDVALLQFTGGTTGVAKPAILTHGNLTAAVSMYRAWRDGTEREPGAQRAIAVLPLFHIYALTSVLLRHLREGNLLLLRQRFDVETLISDIAEHRASAFAGVPTMWVALLNSHGVEAVDFSSLRSCVSGGAPLPFDVQTRLGRLLGRRLNNGWGMTETAPAGTRIPEGAPSRPGLIGIPLPGVSMRVVSLDDPTREVAIDEVGEIAIRGPNVFRGYLGAPDDTAHAFCAGWFLTGDIGRVDAAGLFEIVDRRKNLIISGGFNVYPVQIENAIYEHPDVAEVIVIGVPDAYRGQAAKAFVTLKAGSAALDLAALQAFLADRIGRHEMPRALEIRASLPRSATGKLLASVLVAEERVRDTPQEHTWQESP